MTFMSTTRTARRLITLGASAALIITAPGFVGVAMAHDTPSPRPSSSTAQVTLTPALVTAIQAARDAFKVAARAAMDTYRNAKTAIRADMTADTSLAALHSAKDAARQALELAVKSGTSTPALQTAYDNAKAAYEAAKAPYKVREDAAQNSLKVAIDAAKVAYVAAVKTAFATIAPGMVVPANLLEVSDRHHGFAFGHLNAKHDNGSRGEHANGVRAGGLHTAGMHRR